MRSPLVHLLALFEFTNLPMLGWLAAAALPWLIHRWFRRRHQTTPWAAVELLLGALRNRARRIRVQQWLLLAIRTAILLFVALAVAEPMLRQWALGSGNSATSHRIIVLDQSFSMGCEQQSESRWQRARSYARRWIESQEGDALTLIGWSDQAESLLGRPTYDTSLALAVLDELQLSQSSTDLTMALKAVLAVIEQAKQEMPQLAAHQVLFCTDLGPNTWTINEQITELANQVGTLADVSLVSMADGNSSNLAITDVQVDPTITFRQRESLITAEVSCFGDPPAATVNVVLYVAGQQISRQQVSFTTGDKKTVQFAHRFIEAGAHTVQVALEGNQDSLSTDDQRWLVVEVRPSLQVACIEGQPGSAADLARALSPQVEVITRGSEIEAEVLPVNQLGNLDLFDFDALLLCSVTDLSAREAASLTKYVRQGGAVGFFLNEQTSLALFGEVEQILPVQLDGLKAYGDYRFDPREYKHPIMSPFRGQTQSGLLGVSISQYNQLRLVSNRNTPRIVFSFDTGDPALVVDRFELGRVAVCALPGSLSVRAATGAPWSSFALSPSFLPVVRELIAHLVGDRWQQQRNLTVGDPAVLAWQDEAAVATVRFPDGRSQTLPRLAGEDRGQVVFQETTQQGIYRFSADDSEYARLAVNLHASESDITPVDPSTLPAALAANAVTTSVSTAARNHFSFARSLLAATFILLLIETGLAWMLGRGWG